MMHPPTVTDGDLAAHELTELFGELDEASGVLGLPEHFVLGISAFSLRRARLGATQ